MLLLVYTDRGSDVDTESDIKLQIAASGQLMLDQKLTHDFDRVRAYWHFLEVERPFTRADIASKGVNPPQHPGNRCLAADDRLRLRA